MAVTSREELKQYCLRELGAPVLEINVDDDQLEDRIDEALEFWRLYHYEGIEKVYLKHKMRASQLHLVEAIAETFPNRSIVVGAVSGAKARVITEFDNQSQGNTLLVRNIEGEFQAGETVTTTSAFGDPVSATLDDPAVTLGEFDKKYIEVPDWVYGVTRILPFAGTQMSKSMFDIQYQLRLNDLYDLASTSIIYYKQVMSHLSLLDLELNGRPMFRFNRLQNRIYPDINWEADVVPGSFVVVECYRALNPAEFSRVWSELWLKRYTAALFKRQWGTNMKKFQGLQLPGGVTMDGQTIFQEALQDIKELEDELMNKSAPLEWFMG